MLISILSNPDTSVGEKLSTVLVIAFCVLLSLSVHELCHGLVAYWMGDKTAKDSGRLSLNPLHHMDPFGALCLFLFGFGWAKPVPVNSWNFNNRKGGMVLTALGGPVSNFLMAFIAQIGITFLERMTFVSDTSFSYMFASLCYMLCTYMALLNLGLGLFNLIPIPPLDGSKVLTALLPERLYFKLMQYERFGFILLIVLINTRFFNQLLVIGRNYIVEFYEWIIAFLIH